MDHGRLTARPGPDLYLYTFPHPGGPLPEIGRRGSFICGPDRFPARLADRRGPLISVTLTADKALGSDLSGRFQADESKKTEDLAPRQPLPTGTELFLDSREGWAISAAEAAGQKDSAFEAEYWPLTPRQDLPEFLAGRGIAFIWRQAPDREEKTARLLAQHFAAEGGSLLLTASSPTEMEALAPLLPQGVYAAEAGAESPLSPLSLYRRAAEAAEVRDRELAALRGDFESLKREESGLKARLTQWDDLAKLQTRFEALGRELESRRRHWERVREDLLRAQDAWEEASLDKDKKGLLGWLRPDRPDPKNARREEEKRQALAAAELAMNGVRQEEESSLREARRLDERLRETLLDSEGWTARPELDKSLAELKSRQDDLAARIVACQARALPSPGDFVKKSPLVLALLDDLPYIHELAGRKFETVLALNSRPPDHQGRRELAALALRAEKRLIILGDFTFWPVWSGRAPAPPEAPESPAWSGLIVAEDADARRDFLVRDGLFQDEAELPPAFPRPARLELGQKYAPESPPPLKFNYIVPPGRESDGDDAPPLPATARPPKNRSQEAACGLGLRAVSELGPVNPVSALMTAKAALNFALGREKAEPAVIILTASPSQAQLINLMLKDLNAPSGRIFCGEAQDFDYWPQAPLVILEPAFEAPHLSHPWAWPSYGRLRLMRAWSLAGEEVWLSGRDGWMKRLPAASPLAALWRLAGRSEAAGQFSDPGKSPVPTFWEALDQAKQEVWAIVPVFEQFWWRPLEEHFLAAARRRVQISLLSAPPGPGDDRDYASSVIRTLATYGCSVHLASGFPGFLAVVDERHLSWGHFIEGRKGAHIWGGLKSAVLPQAAPLIEDILQLKLINEKLGRRGGGLKNCPQCGWPMLLINQEQMRGYSDDQPLKLGCLGDCHSRPKNARRLDEREPFQAPPKCGVDRFTAYERIWKGRQETWVCPRHPDGADCPSFRVLSGDVKAGRGTT